jgi:hypothetical protein
LTPEEARELVRRMRAREENAARIKQEAGVRIKREKRARTTDVEDDDDDDDDGVEITGEGRSSKRARQSTDSAVEIVDLTDD